jgi:hypothetical protein
MEMAPDRIEVKRTRRGEFDRELEHLLQDVCGVCSILQKFWTALR